MKKYVLLFSIIFIFGIIAVFYFYGDSIREKYFKKYETQEYRVGEYLIKGRDRFEDISDFRSYVCSSKGLSSNCGELSQINNQTLLNIKENAMDDSIAEVETIYTLAIAPANERIYVSKIQSRWTCHENRGSTSWTTKPCK